IVIPSVARRSECDQAHSRGILGLFFRRCAARRPSAEWKCSCDVHYGTLYENSATGRKHSERAKERAKPASAQVKIIPPPLEAFLFKSCLLMFLLAATASAATISGTVNNGTTGKP